MPGITSTTNFRINYTPRGTGAVSTTLFIESAHGRQPSRFDDGPEAFKKTTLTEGGKAVTIVHDVFDIVTVRVESIPIDSVDVLWAELQNWWMHAAVGGLFSCSLSRERSNQFTPAIAMSQGDLSAVVDSDPTIIPQLAKQNDTLRIVDAVDPTLREYVIIDADATASPHTVTWKPALARDYAAGSNIFFADDYDDCLAVQDKHPLRRREAKAGAFVWDFTLTFRTTRV